jgi:hypothetical protein
LGPDTFYDGGKESVLYIDWEKAIWSIDRKMDMSQGRRLMFEPNTQYEAYQRAVGQGSMVKLREDKNNEEFVQQIFNKGFSYFVNGTGGLFKTTAYHKERPYQEFFVKRVVDSDVAWAVYRDGFAEDFCILGASANRYKTVFDSDIMTLLEPTNV